MVKIVYRHGGVKSNIKKKRKKNPRLNEFRGDIYTAIPRYPYMFNICLYTDTAVYKQRDGNLISPLLYNIFPVPHNIIKRCRADDVHFVYLL